jgi:splicing factor 3A subunit 1
MNQQHFDPRSTAGPTVGPQLGTPGPQAIPPAQAAGASTPGGGIAFSGAVISAGPQGPSAPQPSQAPQTFYQPYPDQSQFQPFHDQPAFDPSVFNMPSMPPQQPGPDGLPPPPVGLPTKPPLGGIHPSRLAVMGGASPGMPNMPAPYVGSPYGQAAGQVRPHEDDGTPDGSAPAKRQKVEKLPTGQLYPVSRTNFVLYILLAHGCFLRRHTGI